MSRGRDLPSARLEQWLDHAAEFLTGLYVMLVVGVVPALSANALTAAAFFVAGLIVDALTILAIGYVQGRLS